VAEAEFTNHREIKAIEEPRTFQANWSYYLRGIKATLLSGATLLVSIEVAITQY
jgi:hypothetical protein